MGPLLLDKQRYNISCAMEQLGILCPSHDDKQLDKEAA